MKTLTALFNRIVQRVDISLRELDVDIGPYAQNLLALQQLLKFYAILGVSPNHPWDFQCIRSSLAGSYILGKCRVKNAILYKCDIRGDELKKKGDLFRFQQHEIPVTRDEGFDIQDSLLIKTLVHNFSHDPETLERFLIHNTIAAPYANIHGSPSAGSFLAPFATVDLTTMRRCILGAYAYVQAGEIANQKIAPGTIWVRSPDNFNFLYRYPLDRLKHYIDLHAGTRPGGWLIDFMQDHKQAFQRVYDGVHNTASHPEAPSDAALDRFALIEPKTVIHENVLIAQRAYLQNSWMGPGANAQEHCYIFNSRLEGNNVTAHGAKIIEADLDKNVFVGFNSLVRGRAKARLSIGRNTIIMPHTIIDAAEPIAIPAAHMVWGLVTDKKTLETNSLPQKAFSKAKGRLSQGAMVFEGNGAQFMTAFQERIQHILEANGAYFDGARGKGHAQINRNISLNTINPILEGDLQGLYPDISLTS